MFEKLSRVEERYNKIAADLCDPQWWRASAATPP